MMTNYLRSIDSADWSLLTVAAGATFLFAALTLEYVFDQLPCALCLNQRIWMILATLLAAGGLAHNPRLGIYPFLSLISSIVGIGFALRQIYLQITPSAASSCGPGLDYLRTNQFPLSDILKALTTGTGDCAEPSLIPAAALVAFVVLGVGATMQWRN
ncbi:MAG: disulfide bond formation protein B [Pseudomonadota bacterium]|nr:disulfide bond formation protein B [Pseudomonadota bacterium]